MSIHVHDYGTVFSITCLDGSEILDVSDAVTRVAYFKRPSNGALLGPKTLTVPGGGVNGVVSYTFQDGELDTVGEWSFQVKLEFSGGRFHSQVGKFTVYDNIIPAPV